MSDKIPRIKAQKLITFLERIGFKLIRQTGSHRLYRNNDKISVTVPYHSGKTIHPKIIKTILYDTKITIEEFKKLIKSIII